MSEDTKPEVTTVTQTLRTGTGDGTPATPPLVIEAIIFTFCGIAVILILAIIGLIFLRWEVDVAIVDKKLSTMVALFTGVTGFLTGALVNPRTTAK